jgi:hypothetical protein
VLLWASPGTISWSSAPPSRYRSPDRKNIPIVAPAPMYAKTPISGFLRPVRSATAPASGITKTDSSTEAEIAYAKYDPARTGMPRGWT